MPKVKALIKAQIGWIILFILIPLPYIIVYLIGLPEWIGRIIGIGIWALVMSIGCFWISLNPKVDMIKPGAKAYRPSYGKSKTRSEIFLRFLTFLFGVFTSYYMTIPYLQDIYQLIQKGSPIVITSQVREVNQSRKSRIISESVGLISEDKSYSLMFCLDKPIPGDSYDFWILPRSKMILFYE